ncbi:MAG TPA: hypothetical protein VGE13_03755 [Candidatus Saccharimonadales bacterium]
MQELPPLLQRVAEIKQQRAHPDNGEVLVSPETNEEIVEKLRRLAIYSAMESAS